MLAPYPDRLRSSRSNTTSSSQPQPPPPQPQQQQHHSLFHSRSALPLTRMRTNSLTSSSPSQSHRSDSPATTCNDSAPPRLSQNSARRPLLPSQPPTSPLATDHKPAPVVPIVFTSPLAGVSPVTVRVDHFADNHRLPTVHVLQFQPFVDFIPTSRKRTTKRPSFQVVPRKESVTCTPSKASSVPIHTDPDNPVIQDLRLSFATCKSQFKMKGNKKHHAYPANEAPYPRNYERPVIDQCVLYSIPIVTHTILINLQCSDVWETGFVRQLSGSHTFHVFGTPPTKVYVSQLFPKMC
jgi:hypothetical protein